MKKIYMLLTALMALTAMGVSAQTLIDEGFEDVPGNAATSQFPPGWEMVKQYPGSNLTYQWSVQYSSSGSNLIWNK